MAEQNVGGSGDCTIINAIWNKIWDQSSEFYLPKIAKNGLKNSALGLDIAPFDSFEIPSLPEVSMFDEPVLGYMKIKLTDNTASGIDTISGSNLTCDDKTSADTAFGFDIAFSSLNLSGSYTVSAGGGVGGCAIAATAAILGGGTSLAYEGSILAATPGANGSDLAMWYQEPLGESSNGQALIGAYYDNQDSVLDLQSENNGQNAYVQSLSASNVHSTKSNVYSATDYYKQASTGTTMSEEDAAAAPQIGSDDQYNSGQLPYAYLIAMARRKVSSGSDPDGRFKKLADDATQFIGSITWYKTTYPGTQPVGGPDGVLDRIAAADPNEIAAFTAGKSAHDFLSKETLAVLEEDTIAHLADCVVETPDMERWYNAYRAKMAARATESSDVDGTYADENMSISGSISGTITMVEGNLTVTISDLKATVDTLDIKLRQSTGWWPGLFDKVTNWLANDTFIHGEIKKHMASGLTSDHMKTLLEKTLNGALKSL